MKYNLIRNGSLEALTVSGTGNKSLSWLQLETLMNGTTVSGGVTLTASDVLWLEADLSNRIKLDSVRLYASDLTKLANIEFYYKNNESDSYTLCSKNVGTYYYPTLPDPKAPRFVLATISGVDMHLHEYTLINDDYIVNFGEDGSLSAKYLADTPIATEGDPTSVAIFNNSTDVMPADAYCCIDYTDNIADSYLRIAATKNGPWYSIDDGALLESDATNLDYWWSMGKFNNTTLSGNNVVLDDPTISGGVYTSPIFSLDNQYMASYLITDGTTESGTTNISYNENVYNGTIRIRSSNIAPLAVDEIYWLYKGVSGQVIEKAIIYDGSVIANWTFWGVVAYYNPVGTAVDRRTGNVAMSVKYDTGTTHFGWIRRYDKNGEFLYTTSNSRANRCDVNMEFDKFGGIWGYGQYRYLIHYSDKLVSLYLLYDGTDFLYDLAVEMNGDGVWYTNQLDDLVIHKDLDGTTLHTIYLTEPRAICGTSDNGCWVIDNSDRKAYRYNSSGSLVKTVTLNRTAIRMCSDMVDGFWYISGDYYDNHVYHVTSGGKENVDVDVSQPTKIKGGYNGCIVWSESNDWVKYIDKNSGAVMRTFSIPGITITGYPALFSFNFIEFQDVEGFIPLSYDPVWKPNGSLKWKEIKKDGYFLPKTRYHQVEVTLRNNDGISTPILKKLIIPPAIKVQDIQPQTSKNVYVKTVIPDGIEMTDYETKLKCWWGRNA